MSRALLLLALGCLLFCVPLRTAASEPAAPEKIATVEGVTEWRLANGARVLLFPDASQPTITVNMTVLVGSRHEGYGEAGMAHLLEHMVFKGTPTHPDVPTALRDHGASFNGTTNSDRTNYFETLPATDENLEFAIRLEADRLVNSKILLEDLMSEFTVVRNEFERGENSPQSVLYNRVLAAAYEWHNYGKTTIGNRSDIERVPIHNLRAFYRNYYQPDNVVLIVTGRFEQEQALALANKHFGSIPAATRELTKTYTVEPPQDGERFVELRRVGSIGSVMAAYHVPAAAHEDWAPLSILASVMSEDKVGLLEQALVETKLASSASASADNAHDPGLFVVGVQPTEGNLEKAREVLLKTMDGLGDVKFTQDAVNRAKKRAERNAEETLVDAGRMAQALSTASSLGDWRLWFIQRDRVQQVTLDDVHRVAGAYFAPHNRTVGTFIPTDEPQRANIPEVASLEELVKSYKGGKEIAAGETFDSAPEKLDQRIETSEIGGIKVALLPKENRGETVDLVLTLRYGNEESLQDKTTAAGMISNMLMMGTAELDRQGLQARMTELGVRISPGGGGGGGRGRGGPGLGGGSPGSVSFSISAKRESLVPAIELLGEILRKPAFPEQDFEQIKLAMSGMMKRFQTEPQLLAPIALSRALSPYPKEDVRYVTTVEETIALLDGLTLDQIKAVYDQQLSAASGEIAVVGDFDRDAALAALREVLEDWKSDVAYRSIDRAPLDDLKGKKENINTPDKANAIFAAGLSFPMTDVDAEAEALLLGNFIFGGSTLSSRLGDRIRQKEGLSYGATSQMSLPSKGNDARFTISAITNPKNMDAVEAAALEELQKFLADGPTEKEVADAINAWLEAQKVNRSSDEAIAGQMISNLHLNRTFDFVKQREERISKLTPREIQSAFVKHVDPARLVIIRAGDFGK